MSWVNNVLKNIFEEPQKKVVETIRVTFKGDGKMLPQDENEFMRGHAAGLAFTREHYKKLRYDCPWPENWGAGYFGNGFAEGCIAGRSEIMYGDYPGFISITLRKDNRYDVEFKDGKKIIV